MKLTNGDIFSASEPLKKLMDIKLPVKTSYQLAKLASKLNEQLKVIDEVRNGLVRSYGEEKDGKLEVIPENPNWSKFVDEFNELMVQEVDVAIEKVKLPETVAATCDKCHHNMDKALEIEPSALMALDKFIEVV